MKNLFNIFIVALLVLPLVSSAQLTSENFQVDGYSAGSYNQSGGATSTNYQLNQETGGLYEYGDPVVPPTPGGGGGSGGSGSGKKSPKEDKSDEPSATYSTLIGPKTVFEGDVVTLAVSVKTIDNKNSQQGGDTVVFTVNDGAISTTPVRYLGNGIYITTYISKSVGEDIVTARLNGHVVQKDSDGNSDGILHISVKTKGKPAIPPGQEKKQNTSTTTTTPSTPNPPPTTPLIVDSGVTAACNRAFTWNIDTAATIYRTIEFLNEEFLVQTSAVMPWFVDTDALVSPIRTYTYRFEFANGDTTSIEFEQDAFDTCTSDAGSVIGTDIDSDSNTEEYIEGIYQDRDGSSVPLATTPDGIVLDTNADNEPDLFWNPLLGTSSVISAGDRIFITDATVAPTQTFLPYTPGTAYRVKLAPSGNGNVALVFEAVSLTELNEALPLSTIPLRPFEAAGLGSGALLVLMRHFRIPFSISNISRMFAHGWSHFFEFVVFWRRRRAWGTVYDSATKAPVDPAYVELFDENDAKQAEAITDLDGRYGFVIPDGSYYMKVRKTHYEFPSQRNVGAHTDTIYSNIYFGGQFEAHAAIARDIPMDQVDFDWNQVEKMRTHQTRFIHRFDPALTVILDVLFYFGAALMAWQVITEPGVLTAILFIIYAILLFLRITRGKPPLYGTLKRGKKVLPFALIHIIQGETKILSKVTDAHGRYVALIAPGSYTLRVEELVAQETYEVVYEGPVNAKKGIINQSIQIHG